MSAQSALSLALPPSVGLIVGEILCSSACTVTLVHEFSLPPFTLTLEEGALIAGAVLAVWTVGFGFRAVIRTLNIDSKTSTSESEI